VDNAPDHDSGPEVSAHAAAAWVLRQDRGLTAAEQDEFSQWLASDPDHGTQFARHRRHWQRLESLTQWRPEHSALPNPDLLAPPRSRWWRYAPAVGLAAAAVVVGMFVLSRLAPVAPLRTVPAAITPGATPVTERILADGTVVELNQGAVLTVEYSPELRRVRLERGEAHFNVTKNPARPFIVSAHGMDVFAVGTAFNVRLDRAAVEVLVTEGRVRVCEAPAPSNAPGEARPPLVPLLEAGQRAVVSVAPTPAAPQIATLTAGEIERVLAWQHRMLDFTAAPMSAVVAEFNRRNPVQLVIVDPELAAIPVSAAFRSDNIEGFVRLIEVGFGARAERRGDREILLRKAR